MPRTATPEAEKAAIFTMHVPPSLRSKIEPELEKFGGFVSYEDYVLAVLDDLSAGHLPKSLKARVDRMVKAFAPEGGKGK